MDKKQMQDFVDAMGLIAETSLLFFRNLIKAGANVEEASRLTQAFLGATMFGGNTGSKPPENKEA